MSKESTLSKILVTPISKLSFGIIGLFVLLAILAEIGVIAQGYSDTNMDFSYFPPGSDHWFGTDFLGRDVLARTIHGAKIALLVGFFSATIATVIGLFMGSISGYYGGWIDDVVVWIYTTIQSIPYILLISAFAFSLGQGLGNLYIALGLTSWVKLCRLTRGEFLKHKNQDYVVAAQALGTSHWNRIVKHILPNVLHLAYIQYSLTFIMAIKLEVILSFLGLGVEPGTPSWGTMISDAKTELTRGIWWNLAAATSFMLLLILSVNFLSESIRRALDPKSKSLNINL